MNTLPKIFFHVGLGKTGTTYLQYKFFPKLNGVKYIQRTRYKNAKKLIDTSKKETYFISREFDQQFSKEVQWFAEDFKNVRAIIVLRRHDSWIASQYRRFTKNGFNLSFTEFFDVKYDNGYFKKEDLTFYSKIIELEKTFQHKPLVLFHDDLKNDAFSFFDTIADAMNASYQKDKIDLSSKHKSYSSKQLSAILSVGKHINIRKKPTFFLIAFFREIFRYAILYIAKIIPANFCSKQYSLPKEDLNTIKDNFKEDWEKCIEYAAKYN